MQQSWDGPKTIGSDNTPGLSGIGSQDPLDMHLGAADLVTPIRQYEPFINGSLPLMNVPPIG